MCGLQAPLQGSLFLQTVTNSKKKNKPHIVFTMKLEVTSFWGLFGNSGSPAQIEHPLFVLEADPGPHIAYDNHCY